MDRHITRAQQSLTAQLQQPPSLPSLGGWHEVHPFPAPVCQALSAPHQIARVQKRMAKMSPPWHGSTSSRPQPLLG